MTDENYEAVLADLEQKREEIETAIRAIRSLMGLPSVSPTPEVARAVGQGKLREDEFLGMSIPKAILRLLELRRKPLKTPEIARELRAHGLINDSPNFVNTVYNALHRQQSKGAIRQTTGKRWGLASWQPSVRKTREGTNGATASDEPPNEAEPPDERSRDDAKP